ncbi:hypothetical protein JR316_0002044 [Psilocybe cubensis]|uniref:Uncharacterized protein n=2 Tax=Psilocybe cubensis TaxID=181762 RepID=A0A8H8CPX4_PSICU|nr:hypothetical protein JR316_0002044 [Psilocybe cubensis]KAH9485137.1 hypothetical protein JR316_0002044 [Psilocybe cubensis]
MPIATAPALLIGLGARILLDYFSRSDGPFVKDFILIGTWQGVALHYAAKTSKTSGFGIIVAFGIAAKLFIEFNFASDVTRCITTILGVALGVLFTDFLSQYFDKPPQGSDRRKKKVPASKSSKRHLEKVAPTPSSVLGGSVETLADITDGGTLATSSHLFSDITSVESHSDRNGPTSFASALEREAHVLRTRASLADSERRRFKEERKWAISQGNLARASQMKWEVKRYTALMQTFIREAEMKEMEAAASSSNGNGYKPTDHDPPRPIASSSKEKTTRSSRDSPSSSRGNGNPTSARKSTQLRRPTPSKTPAARDANG